MPSDRSTAVQEAVVAAVCSPGYRPADLPPLDDQFWKSFAAQPTDLIHNAKMKRTRQGYAKSGKLALEHTVAIILGDEMIDQPESFLNTVQREVLSAKVLTEIVRRLDSRLIKNAASQLDVGLLQFVGALWTNLNHNTGEIAALFWPTMEPLVDAAAAAYLESKSSKSEKKKSKSAPQAAASLSIRTPRNTQAPPHASPTHSTSSDSDDSMSSARSGADGIASPSYQFRVESPPVSPAAFESESYNASGNTPPFNFNRSLKFPPAVLRTPVRMTEDEALRGKDFFHYSPALAYDLSDAPMPSPPMFKLNRKLALARNPDEGDSILREIENAPPPSGGHASLLAPAFVPVVKKTQSNATASSSKLTLDSGAVVAKSAVRAPLSPNNGRSPRT
ncbi:hypothetical protein DFH06DRAFT_1298258 [Mycena polygramma]|nr:hypothetical protein DFH06DRAFT_1298258 [Mycena polygramma]